MESSLFSEFALIVLGFILSAIAIEIITRYYIRRVASRMTNIDVDTIKIIKKLSYTYILFNFFEYFIDKLGGGVLYIPALGAISFIYIIVISLVIYNKFSNINGDPLVKQDLKSIVNNVISSNDFYTTLSTSLPKGERDGEFGLDYIPYMLMNLSKKKENYKKSSNRFLISIVLLSIFFIILITSASYLLLQESSVGFYKDLKELNQNTDNLNKSVNQFMNTDKDQQYFKDEISPIIKELQGFSYNTLSNHRTKNADSVNYFLSNFTQNGNVNLLIASLLKGKLTFSVDRKDNSNDSKYITLYNTLLNKLIDYKDIKASLLSNGRQSVIELRTITKKIDSKLDTFRYSEAELIKRLILSVVVVTFCIAILRYFRALYQNHYEEMLKAEAQDLEIRKFYVVLKNIESDPEVKKDVLRSFLSFKSVTTSSDGNSSIPNQIDEGFLKEILSSILKKF